MSHVGHMGFDLELKHDRIVRVLRLASVKAEDVDAVIEHLKPIKLQRAVADTMEQIRAGRNV